MTRNLLDIANHTTIRSLIREGIAQGCTYGMSGEMLDMSSEVEQLMFAASVRMDSRHCKRPMSQCASLVEDHRTHLCQHIHIVGALH